MQPILALARKEIENNLSFMASSLIPFIWMISPISKNMAKYAFGSSMVLPSNWDCWTSWLSDGLILKLSGFTIGHAMLVCDLWVRGRAKFLRDHLFASFSAIYFSKGNSIDISSILCCTSSSSYGVRFLCCLSILSIFESKGATTCNARCIHYKKEEKNNVIFISQK